MNYFILAMLIFILAGCCSMKSINEDHLTYNITVGSGGGFTGNYDGFYIDSTGVIQKWKGKTFETAEFQIIGRLTADQIDELNKYITDQGIMKQNYRHPGNITQFIILRKSSSENKISWEGTSPGSDVPESVRKLYMEISAIVKNQQK